MYDESNESMRSKIYILTKADWMFKKHLYRKSFRQHMDSVILVDRDVTYEDKLLAGTL